MSYISTDIPSTLTKTNKTTKTTPNKKTSKHNKHNNAADKEQWNKVDTLFLGNANKVEQPTSATNKIIAAGPTAYSNDFCINCQSILAIADEGYSACTNKECGILYKGMIDQSPEWRYYGPDDNNNSDPTRCGMPVNPLLRESSYGCKITGTRFSYEMRRIKRYTEWISMPYNEKSQYDDFQHITSLANNAGIPQIIIDTALYYYKKIAEYEKSYRGDNKDGIIAASIYIASKIHGYHRTAKELAAMFNLDISSATKGCKTAQIIINDIEKDMDMEDKTQFCQTKPKAFIERYCSKLHMNHKLTQWCYFIAVKIDSNNMMPGNTPQSIAAGIIYFVSKMCKLNISKKNVNFISDISEVTITKCVKKIEQFSDYLIPDDIRRTYNIN